MRLGWDPACRTASRTCRTFNGAEAFTSDGTYSAHNGSSAGSASMGPRLSPRMGRRVATYVSGLRAASMGPRLSPRMGRTPSTAPCRDGCFNGAEAFASDGTPARPVADGRDEASMEPRLPPRMGLVDAEAAYLAQVLQWGRGFHLGWDEFRSHIAAVAVIASMGPRLSPRMGPPGRRGGLSGAGASMGPRLSPRMGQEARDNVTLEAVLQWGRGLRLGWDAHVAGKLAELLVPSMGPRLAPRMGRCRGLCR